MSVLTIKEFVEVAKTTNIVVFEEQMIFDTNWS